VHLVLPYVHQTHHVHCYPVVLMILSLLVGQVIQAGQVLQVPQDRLQVLLLLVLLLLHLFLVLLNRQLVL
jgi:hypothetical protein